MLQSKAMTAEKPAIKMVTGNKKRGSKKSKNAGFQSEKAQKVSLVSKLRTGFLKTARNLSIATSICVIVYLTATVLIPTIGSALADSVGLTGQVHFYNMLQIWGFPMLCITGVIIVGAFYLCRYVAKKFNEFFEPRINAGLITGSVTGSPAPKIEKE